MTECIHQSLGYVTPVEIEGGGAGSAALFSPKLWLICSTNSTAVQVEKIRAITKSVAGRYHNDADWK
jgi:hypothetical protein